MGSIRDYKLDQAPLGEGGGGSVYRSLHLPTGEIVAVKVVSLSSKDARHRLRFERECGLICGSRSRQKLGADRVVRGREYFYDPANKTGYLVMELLDGESIHKCQSRFGPLGIYFTLMTIQDVLSGLTFLHGIECVHRDIKPLNLILQPDCRARIVDLGLAWANDGIDITGTQLPPGGTWLYSAPECFGNSSKTSFPADIYSVGATLYSMLAGRPPGFELSISRINDMKRWINQEDWSPEPLKSFRDDVPRLLNDLVSRSLLLNPRKRPSLKEMHDSIRRLCRFLSDVVTFLENTERLLIGLMGQVKGDLTADPADNATVYYNGLTQFIAATVKSSGQSSSFEGRLTPEAEFDDVLPDSWQTACQLELLRIRNLWNDVLRLSKGPSTTKSDMDIVLAETESVVRKLRALRCAIR